MVAKQTIVSPLFNTRTRLSQVMLRSLLVRGSGIQVDDSLRRFGWDGAQAAATTVMTIDEDSGTVSGVRLEMRGKGPEVKFKAKDLWIDAEVDIMVTLQFDDLSKVTWITGGQTGIRVTGWSQKISMWCSGRPTDTGWRTLRT